MNKYLCNCILISIQEIHDIKTRGSGCKTTHIFNLCARQKQVIGFIFPAPSPVPELVKEWSLSKSLSPVNCTELFQFLPSLTTHIYYITPYLPCIYSWTACFWRWRHYDPSTCWELLIQQHSITSQKTQIFSTTTIYQVYSLPHWPVTRLNHLLVHILTKDYQVKNLLTMTYCMQKIYEHTTVSWCHETPKQTPV